jgi:LysM repeat protein
MRTSRQSGGGGVERYVLALALLVPLAIGLLALFELPGIEVQVPTRAVYAESSSSPIVTHRPAASEPAPPPTLAAPTATPGPTVTPIVVASPTPVGPRTYTVQKGDELKQIAAQYGVSIWKIIDANHIPNPDSLTVGQVLHIPDS